jgi:hypothetical protein
VKKAHGRKSLARANAPASAPELWSVAPEPRDTDVGGVNADLVQDAAQRGPSGGRARIEIDLRSGVAGWFAAR